MFTTVCTYISLPPKGDDSAANVIAMNDPRVERTAPGRLVLLQSLALVPTTTPEVLYGGRLAPTRHNRRSSQMFAGRAAGRTSRDAAFSTVGIALVMPRLSEHLGSLSDGDRALGQTLSFRARSVQPDGERVKECVSLQAG